jgi:hypothetical protein
MSAASLRSSQPPAHSTPYVGRSLSGRRRASARRLRAKQSPSREDGCQVIDRVVALQFYAIEPAYLNLSNTAGQPTGPRNEVDAALPVAAESV